ncbi:translation initiation factor IF-2 [Candidatus Sulfobium mesophilum]|uniref:Translation initiation factor IF-2 n=1 Tax=Candidatus Sulfobium mesophilum TaxID=2016548 RepID=A0A2U3QGX6_9BACT|nr:translation initiation factor IF-2 [Candidatus Sulfobium mesophilum]
MSKVRIYELAKKLNRHNKEVLDELLKLGIEGKTHSSSIEADVAEKITKALTAPPPSATDAVVKKPVQKAAVKAEEKMAEPQKVALKQKAEAGEAYEGKVASEAAAARPASPKKDRAEGLQPEQKEAQGAVAETAEKDTSAGEEPVVHALPAAETEEDLKLPDKFKKEIEAEKIEKFKAKPGLQRAFQAIRKIEPKRWDIKGGKHKGDRGRFGQKQETKGQILSTMPRKKNLKLREGTTVKEFSELIGLKFSDVIKKFMELGYMPTINQPVDSDAALIVAESFGIKLELASVEEDTHVEEIQEDVTKLTPRAPVVTIMGHVDHGKTSLLDAIRETKVTETEAGGITQHIGAYKVNLKGKDIVFLDTPGHEAFTSMRARGAKVTDIVVLVVAADDGVMPQTVEAINHAKAANVPIVVAVNKIDKPEANPAKVKSELSEHGIISEEWGGHNIFVEVSAKKRIGIEHVLEMILLQAEIMELKANPDREAKGTVIEAKLDKGRGPVATLLVQTGTLKVGDAILSGVHVGKVRALIDDSGKRILTGGPSTPVEVIGFSEVPAAGDVFTVVEDEKRARQIAMARFQKQRSLEIAKAKKLTLDELYTKIKEGQIKELNIIIKGDVQGSVEALKDALENIHHPEVKVKVIHTSVGGINESDVMLATASNAIIIGFNVRPETKASQTAEKEGVDIRLYNVIYETIEDVKKALEGMLEPTLKEKVLGRAEVRQLFPVSRLGTIAGCYVVDGYMSRACDGIRVLRDNIVVYEGKLSTLKRFKDDVKEVQTGYECGILIENYNDLKVGDILENYIIEKIAAKL